jgi:hypothetical protein
MKVGASEADAKETSDIQYTDDNVFIIHVHVNGHDNCYILLLFTDVKK